MQTNTFTKQTLLDFIAGVAFSQDIGWIHTEALLEHRQALALLIFNDLESNKDMDWLGAKNCSKSFIVIAYTLWKIFNDDMVEFLWTRKFYTLFKQTISTMVKVAYILEREYDVQLYNEFHIIELQNELVKPMFRLQSIKFRNEPRIRLVGWDNANHFQSLQTFSESRYFRGIWNEEIISLKKTDDSKKIIIYKDYYENNISDILQRNKNSILYGKVINTYNPNEDTWIYNDRGNKLIPWTDSLIKKFSWKSPVIRKEALNLIVYRFSYYMNPLFLDKQICDTFIAKCKEKTKVNKTYFQHMLYGKPHFNMVNEYLPFYIGNVVPISRELKQEKYLEKLLHLSIGVDYGIHDRTVMTLSGVIYDDDIDNRKLIVIKEAVSKKTGRDENAKDVLDRLFIQILEVLDKSPYYHWINKEHIAINFFNNDGNIVKIWYDDNIKDNTVLCDKFVLGKRISGNVKDWKLEDKHYFMRYMLEQKRICYDNYFTKSIPRILIQNVLDTNYDKYKNKPVTPRDGDGWDAFIYSIELFRIYF